MEKVLIISNFSWYHHLATDLEIALQMRDQGHVVHFIWIDADNLENVGCDSLSAKRRIRIRKLIKNACSYLKGSGVEANIQSVAKCEDSKAVELFEYHEQDGLEGIRRFEISGRNLGIGVISSVISATKETRPGLEHYRPEYQLAFVSAYKVFMATLRVLKNYVPDILITFNGRFATSRAISEAGKKFGTKVLYHERGANPKKFLLRDFQPHDFYKNRKLVQELWQNADPLTRAEIAQGWFGRRRKNQKEEFKDFLSENTRSYSRKIWGRKLAVFFASSPDEFESVGDLIEHPLFSNQEEAIDWLTEYFRKNQETEFVVRVHPHAAEKSEVDQEYWRGLETKAEVVQFDSKINSYDLISKSDMVLSYGSTAGVEAANMGKPSILLGDAVYRQFGCVYEPESTQELAKLLQRPFPEPLPVENTFPFGFFQSEKGEPFHHFQPSGFAYGTFNGKDLRPKVHFVAARRLVRRVLRNLSLGDDSRK